MHARSVEKRIRAHEPIKTANIGHVPLPATEAEHFKENVMPIFTISYFLIVLCIKYYIPNLFLSFHSRLTNKIPRRFYSRQGTLPLSIFTLRPNPHPPPSSKSANSFHPSSQSPTCIQTHPESGEYYQS